MTDEIALFLDFENIRYSLINVQHREPDPQELIGLARRFGTIMVARAYADWTRQPEFFKGSLTAAMIDRVDCPAKVRERFRQNPGAPQPYQQHTPYTTAPLPENEEMDDQDYDDDEESGDEEQDLRLTSISTRTEISETVDELTGDEECIREESEQIEERRGREPMRYDNHGGYYQGPPQPVITQSTVDLNMLMDIIETVFDRPSINTFILMTGDRDFTRICARLKLRLNKRVIVVGVPGTVSRDLVSAAEQFIPLGFGSGPLHNGGGYNAAAQAQFQPAQGPVEPDEAGFIQFLDYIDRHWSWRTVGGVANFIGDPFNPKNRFRGRLTRESARDLLRICIDEGILIVTTDVTGSENLRLNRNHPAVDSVLNETAMR
ncbi:MAG TPA: NYN domain-containing protein [Ktedonobacterales bacterium]|nr:NYN domain-containing protein [Ktedonobacterales bacterium]